MLGAWLSHPSHVCCGLLSGRQHFCAVIVGEEGEQGKAFVACSLSSLVVHLCSCWGVLREREQLHSHISLTVPPNY